MATRVVNVRGAIWRSTPPKDRVFIGRPSKWGNPYKIAPGYCTRSEAVARFREYLNEEQPELRAAVRKELRGKVLGCYCKPLACHGDVLAEIADG